jgi:exosortase O
MGLTRRVAVHVVNLTLLVLWVWLYRPVFQYLAVLFTREEFRTNQIVLVSVTGLLLVQARRAHLRLHGNLAPHLFVPGLALALGSSLAYLLVERYLDINILSAVLFGLASYGLLGLWILPERWWQGFPAMLLVVGVLPFGEHLETFVGYPLRTFTAGLVRDGLSVLGFHSVGVDTILVFESGISQVDIPCSGVKSLWTGALFLLAATWIENRTLSLRWLLVAAATGALLFAANLLRVAILTLLGPSLGWTELARMAHVPLGMLGFSGACLAALVLLRRLPTRSAERPAASFSPQGRSLSRPGWLAPLVALVVLALALFYSPRAASGAGQAASAAAPPAWSFPESIVVQASPLTAQQLAWIRQAGAETADRYTFRWQDTVQFAARGQPVSGTLMLLTSQTWRGQHPPEHCFEVFGLTVRASYTSMAAPDFPLRYLTLSGSGGPGPISAVYWLQSASQTTEDFGQRIWADLGPKREPWVLVTILFDQEYDPQLPELVHLFAALHASVGRSFLQGGVP